MNRGLVAALLFALNASGHADDPLQASLALRYSERLSLPPSAVEPAALPPLPPRKSRPRLRRTLSVMTSMAGWSGTRRNDDAEAVVVPRVGLDGSATFRGGLNAALLADAAREQAWPSGDSRTQLALREAWLGWKEGSSSARLGWQIVNWGRTDVLNPTDTVVARDYTRLVDRDGDQKLGLPMLMVQQRFGSDTTVQALWQPQFRSSRVPLPAVDGARYIKRRPDWTLGAAGLRVDHVGEQLSGSISYLRGPARLPNLALTVDDFSAGVLPLNHPWAETVGADVEVVRGAWLIRGESAWTRVSGSGTNALASRESALDTVLGIERSLGSASAFVQAEWKHIPGWVDPVSIAEPLLALARGNASFNDELHRNRGQIGIGYALNTSDLRWSASFDAAWAPADSDWVLRPRLRFRLNDRIQIFAGGDWFRGPALGVYGRLQPRSAIFLGVTSAWSPPVSSRTRG